VVEEDSPPLTSGNLLFISPHTLGPFVPAQLRLRQNEAG
jgi:hypothetical protein